MADDESTRTGRRWNWTRGLWRLWIACSVSWVLVTFVWFSIAPLKVKVDYGYSQAHIDRQYRERNTKMLAIMLMPPPLALGVGAGIYWALRGFRIRT